ncbi:hypothetical protein [Saccharicrinis carchari]|uniref:hypothetical protein n=1 Tax=Saccharicrinis carchari TaxID=1168039 RepID=UPI00115A738B|nr:hypothetical protein [Saccharicrinis carchari]
MHDFNKNHNPAHPIIGQLKTLAAKGHTFYARCGQYTGLLSRVTILSQEAFFPVKNNQRSITKAIIDV